jgi:hypothetical protein
MDCRASRLQAGSGLGRALAVLSSTLALAGCGASSHSPTSASSGTAAPTTSPTSSTTQRRPPAHHRHRYRKPTPANQATSTGSVQTAPSPPPAGTPPAPAGLRATTGYGTYELCSAQCGGAVPASLRRPLHLPVACRVSAGSGPVKALGSPSVMLSPFIGSVWKAARVTWVAATSYLGPILIRGHQLGGPGAVGFGEGRSPYDELQLLAPGSNAPSVPGQGRAWLSFTRVRGPGCYAYQVDGSSFSTVIVFRAAG